MTPRQKRMGWVGLVIAGVALSAALASQAFKENLFFFYSPTQVNSGEAPSDKTIRIGGLVIPGSIERAEGSLTVRFMVTDTEETIPVEYTGILPDLFKDGQGVIARGRMGGDKFVAQEVLAKHDENYMPPEVADAIHSARKQ